MKGSNILGHFADLLMDFLQDRSLIEKSIEKMKKIIQNILRKYLNGKAFPGMHLVDGRIGATPNYVLGGEAMPYIYMKI